ncbi:class I SAM-dependent methyltransferase [Streptacidiphilus sp. 4-A2]|nr:class I SAM-dependent methyltransferase [Streptacidiphilus sp. 4-A2]
MTEARERRGVFGEVTDAYEAARPGYPSALVDDVLDYARLDGAPVVEVGAGTGKASTAFAARDIDLVCVEHDARMAEVLAAGCAPYPRTSVVVSGFEQWQPPAERYGLLFSAQAWHWIDPATRWTLAFEALRPGAAIALFWNQYQVRDPQARAALVAAHQRHGAAELSPATLGSADREPLDRYNQQPLPELLADDRYRDAEFRYYRSEYSYTGSRYQDLLASLSAYRLLPRAARGASRRCRPGGGHPRRHSRTRGRHQPPPRPHPKRVAAANSRPAPAPAAAAVCG